MWLRQSLSSTTTPTNSKPSLASTSLSFRRSISFFWMVIVCVLVWPNNSANGSAIGTIDGSSNPSTHAHSGMRTILRIYDECTRAEGGFVPCLKKKAITFIDRISHIDAITVADGIKVIRLPANEVIPSANGLNSISSSASASAAAAASSSLSPTVAKTPSVAGSGLGSAPFVAGLYSSHDPLLSENELESSLSRSAEDRDMKLTKMLVERLSHYFNGHSLQVSFPKISVEEIGRSLEEGRGKMKKMMGTMMMGLAMKMMGMLPLALGSLFILAGKALIVSKIALLLAGIIGLKKLMSDGGGSGGGGGWSSGGGGGGGGGGGWSSGGGGGGGWDRRSFNDAHNLMYRGYNQQYQQQQQHQQQEPAVAQQQQQSVAAMSSKE